MTHRHKMIVVLTAPVYVTLAFVVSVLPCGRAAAQDMPLSDVLIEGQGWKLVADGFKFTEGPAVDGRGNLYFTDVPHSKIHRLDAKTGDVTVVVDNSERTNGLMFGPDGLLYGCRNGAWSIVAYNSGFRPKTVASDVRCNDLVVTRNGGVYFTDPTNQQVWFVDSQGKKRVVDKGIGRPNGIILWPDGGTLVVADTAGKHLWAFRVEDDGSLSHKQPYYTMRMLPEMIAAGRGGGADGMTVESDGRRFVATHAGLQMGDTTGRVGGVILKPQPRFLSNVVFGGPEFDTLYVTCSDKVYCRKTKARGLRTRGKP